MKKLLSLYTEEGILNKFTQLTEQKLGIEKHKAVEFLISLVVNKQENYNLWQREIIKRIKNNLDDTH